MMHTLYLFKPAEITADGNFSADLVPRVISVCN